MEGKVNFIDNISIAWGWGEVLNSLITSFINQSDIITYTQNTLDAMYFKRQKALSLDQKFTSKSWAIELEERDENWVIAEIPSSKTPNKWFRIKEFWGKKSVTQLFNKWATITEVINMADTNVKMAFAKFKEDGFDLLEGAKINIELEAVKLLTNWFSVTSDFWPWSPTPKGLSLFNANHTIDNGYVTRTFSNILSTPNQAFSVATLQEMIDIHKTELLMDNWHRTPMPAVYEIWCGRALATEVRKAINTPWSQAGIFSWDTTNTNSNVQNQFNFEWNRIEIKEIARLWEYTGKWVKIWLDTMYFLVNPMLLKKMEGFRFISLYSPEVSTYVNNETKATVTDVTLWFALDHYWAECAIVWSQWTV